MQFTKSLRWIGSEVSQIPQVKSFLAEYEIQVPSFQRLKALDVALRATPTRWWVEHKQNIATWKTCQRLLMIRFGQKLGELECQYNGEIDPRIHVEFFTKKWQHRSADEWVHLFIHTLDTNSRNWYTETELRRGIKNWSLMVGEFELTFNFDSNYPEVDDVLESIKERIFDTDSLPVVSYHDWSM